MFRSESVGFISKVARELHLDSMQNKILQILIFTKIEGIRELRTC